MLETLSAPEARRIALAAQGFGRPRPAQPGKRHLLSTIQALGVVQIDSVNVVSRSHYLPFFSRLGAYDRALLEDLAWGRKPALAEYWAHEASLTPLATHPLLRWRMQDARDGVGVWKNVAKFLHTHADFIDQALKAVDKRGPLAASELALGAKGAGGWWGWSEGKRAMECLFWTGRLTTATRRGAFERVYDLPERVLPKAIHDAPTPDRVEACRALLRIAAQAMGVATERDLRDYFRLGVNDARDGVAALAAEGALVPVKVAGWDQPAYLWPEARRPRAIKAAALLSPFDNLIWFRERAERLFDVRVRLEIYTPAHKRTHGYYVLPFLQNEAITARVDLKADRKAGRLLVLAAHAESRADAKTPLALAGELALMAHWLGLQGVEVRPVGDLAPALGSVVEPRAKDASTGL
ncbi:winged helix-turn-helix domain-containing protein [Caulobacter vibrioides]|uniref:winged helix-turn-helix domain-containing protein n=1 Tax=Caulobacter vibrioides TaxID=155892 RepID=UPI000BB4CAD3|nr:winged helix-turn-helix domain-containing protein [Caulobacter vibrioides]ATC26205.1 winged helix-turn-helix domain-containing protein [Caulobacter vibrioides]AZH14343.1 winged helix-turn-helix domain-containing protein [Caulobacter vibrioides]PLR10941.1 winged helix-turn-helix domain-containing protein [Caulobacter vibrioides]